MEKLLRDATWQERYDLSVENAILTYERNQPKEMFWCLVNKKYKTTIWNEAIKKVLANRNQPQLIGDK